MSELKLSLCIICKDEEKLIEDAILSAKKIVDEIIVLDTGSKDKSREIAVLNGAKVYDAEFYYDFSDLRNRCIEKANGDFILFLDCDERIENPDKIKEVLKKIENHVAVSFRVSSYLDNIKRNEENILRLFKKDENIKFNGRVNESIDDSVIKNFGREKILYTDIKIAHFGSDKNIVNMGEKIGRNLKIFSLMADDEKNSKYFYNIGNEYGRMLDFEIALEKYDKALEIFDGEETLKSRIVLNKIKAMHKLGLYEEALEFINKSLLEFEDFRDLYFLKCLCQIQLAHFHGAKESIEEYVRMEKHLKYPSSEFENGMNLKAFYENIEKISREINL